MSFHRPDSLSSSSTTGSSYPFPTSRFGSISSTRLGGGIGLHGGSPVSTHLVGSDSVCGLGMGHASASVGILKFDQQIGRDDATPTTRRQRTSRAHRPAALVAASTTSWRFLKDDVLHTDSHMDGRLQSLTYNHPTVPLTAEGKAYLEQYERMRLAQSSLNSDGGGGAVGGSSFNELLHEQEAGARHQAAYRALQIEHDAFQQTHGTLPLEEYVERRDELRKYDQQLRDRHQEPMPPVSFQLPANATTATTITTAAATATPLRIRPPQMNNSTQARDESTSAPTLLNSADQSPVASQPRAHRRSLNADKGVSEHKEEGATSSSPTLDEAIRPHSEHKESFPSTASSSVPPTSRLDSYSNPSSTRPLSRSPSPSPLPSPSHSTLSPSSSSSCSSSRSTSRSSSPVILWRATNRVKEALDIPAELRSVFIEEPNGYDQEEEDDVGANGMDTDLGHHSLDGDHSITHPRVARPRKSTRLYAPHQLSTLERIALHRHRHDRHYDATNPSDAMQELEWNLNPKLQAERCNIKVAKVKAARQIAKGLGSNAAIATLLATKPPPPDSSFTFKGYIPKVRKTFGAWYLPTKLWIAEEKKATRSHISHRVGTNKAHMSLGMWDSIGLSTHARDILQVGQAEYEETRTRMGLHGLATWEEIQAGALIGSATQNAATRTMYEHAHTHTHTHAHGDGNDDDDDEDPVTVIQRITALKAQSAEARARRRQHAEKMKIEQNERKRQAKKATIVAHQLQQKGIFTQKRATAAAAAASSGLTNSHEDDIGSTPLEDELHTARTGASKMNSATTAAMTSTKFPSTSAGSGSVSSVATKAALVRDQLPQLQIAQEYKSYVQRTGGRIPHYLAQVETAKNGEGRSTQHTRA